MTFNILYGMKNNRRDVTEICLSKLIHNNIITIPKGDLNRAFFFIDHLPGIEKKIFIMIDESEYEYDQNHIIEIDIQVQNKVKILNRIQNKILTNVPKWLDSFIYFLEYSVVENQQILPIWLGMYPSITEKCVYYNTEQLTRKYILSEVLKILKNENILEIWDYSLANIEILKLNNITNTKHVPLESPEWYIKKIKSFQLVDFEYDIGFCGTLSNRRNKILNELKSCGKKVNIVNRWGDDRDRELAKCKIILNIHFEDDYKIFESARCEPWLKIGIPVISEKSLDDDVRCIVSDYESLVQTVVDYLDNFNLNI